MALLESAYIAAAAAEKQTVGLATSKPIVGGDTESGASRHDTLLDCWEQLDSADVKDVMLSRVSMLKGCPHFMRGRLREVFVTAMR